MCLPSCSRNASRTVVCELLCEVLSEVLWVFVSQVTPLVDIAMVETLCAVLGGSLHVSMLPNESEKEALRLTIEASFQASS